jgi:WD40 repeat protein
MAPNIPRIIDGLLKSIDPTLPGNREALLNSVTQALAEIVKTFAFVSFHPGLQKLALGTPEGTIIIHDVRTGTKAQVLKIEGVTKPITAVSFSEDGKMLASYAIGENCVKIWQNSSTLLGLFSGAFGAAASTASSTTSGHGMKLFRSFVIGASKGMFIF